MAAPDSPRSSESPPPIGPLGELEMQLLALGNELYNLGTTVVNDSSKDDKPKKVGMRVNEVINQLAAVDQMGQRIRTTIPQKVIQYIDNAKNPTQVTKEVIERAATDNQFLNGNIVALNSYRELLNEELCKQWPELETQLKRKEASEL
ncbi:hypothetical protein FA15DRAFT_677865 [Coprinopsis marcescibilis]|uniref:Mediator of RNA polymerase II transcription subunit 10 n=1 Tax=Coprinopsis marcescibilis TaxID=230819 RepID=A0A5C3L9C8_COPMA|nr:hypothetical protein FA15DRAFT_677865 [Coprinopsis marcescibilis]